MSRSDVRKDGTEGQRVASTCVNCQRMYGKRITTVFSYCPMCEADYRRSRRMLDNPSYHGEGA